MRSTRLIVNLDNIKHNLFEIKKYIGRNVEIMPIVKANGYGTHLNFRPEILNDFKYVGVALLDEAITLKKNGFKNNIFILFPLSKKETAVAIKNHFIINGSNIFDLIDKNFNKSVRIHLEIDTGMGRTGLQEKDLLNYISLLKDHKNIEVDGIFTHLSSSGSDIVFSQKQIKKFIAIKNIFKKNGINPQYTHICCSGGLKNYKKHLFNMVRIGLLMYGYYPNETLKGKIDLKPAVTLTTKINFIKEIAAGDTVGYNQSFVAKEKTKIATIPFGFADGLVGLDFGSSYVIINNEKAKIVAICMDNIMVDVTNITNVDYNSNVYIWDNNLLKAEEVAGWLNMPSAYQILSSLSERIPRVFESKNKLTKKN